MQSPRHIKPSSPHVNPPRLHPHWASALATSLEPLALSLHPWPGWGPFSFTAAPASPGVVAMVTLESLPPALPFPGRPLPQQLCPSQRRAAAPLFPLRASQRDLAVLMVPGQTLCLVLVVLVNSSVARGRPRPSWVSAEALGRGGRRRAEMLGVGGWMDPSAGPSSGPRAPSASAGRGPPSGSRGPTQSWKDAGQTPRSPSLSTGSFGARRKDFLMTSSP